MEEFHGSFKQTELEISLSSSNSKVPLLSTKPLTKPSLMELEQRMEYR
jgi:hypothetical protein